MTSFRNRLVPVVCGLLFVSSVAFAQSAPSTAAAAKPSAPPAPAAAKPATASSALPAAPSAAAPLAAPNPGSPAAAKAAPALAPTPTASPAAAPSAAKQGIVVWRLEQKEGVSDAEIDSISGTITAQVEQFSGAKVISEADIRTVLKGEETRQKCGAEETSCVAEIGAALGVPEAVSGDLGRVGGFWMLNLRRINVRTAAVAARSTRSIEGTIDDLIRNLPPAVAELFGQTAEVLPAPVLPPDNKVYPMNPLMIAGHTTFWSGLGLSAIGGIAAWQASSKGSDYESGKRSAKSASKAWTGTMYGLFAAGGAAMITGIVLWCVAPSDKDWAEQHPVIVAPTTDGKQAGLVLGLAW